MPDESKPPRPPGKKPPRPSKLTPEQIRSLPPPLPIQGRPKTGKGIPGPSPTVMIPAPDQPGNFQEMPRPRPRKGPPLYRKPDEAEAVPENLADALGTFIQGMTEAPHAGSGYFNPVMAELADPPPDTLGVLTHREAARACELLIEVANRLSEALAIFEPLPVQEEFFRCMAGERLFLGGNRSGKTTTAAVEVARIMTGQDPYSKQPKRDGIAILVGKTLDHCGKVMARKLFRPGQFWMIKDPDTLMWRAFRPHQEWDREHAELKRPAPPLIPARLIKTISWENKKEGIIKSFTLKNGWEATFFSSDSSADPPQGREANLVWFDEEIEHRDFYLECSMRLIDRGGLFIWSATPQAGTIELYDLYERATNPEKSEDDDISAFQMSMLDNPHLTEKERNKAIAKIKDEGDIEVRIEGKFALHGIKIYPEFSARGTHYFPDQEIPVNWTRYVAVDPGVQVCGVLFGAVPPPNTRGFYPGQWVIYDELYIRRCDAKLFGLEMSKKCSGLRIHSWAIDKRMGRQTGPTGKTYQQHYEEALRDNKLTSERTGWRMLQASDDVSGGIEAVRIALRDGGRGYPLILVGERCVMFAKEATRYTFVKKPSGEITDIPTKRRYHMMDCLRYLTMMQPRYRGVKAEERMERGTALGILNAKRERAKLKKRQGGAGFISLG